MGSYLCYCDTVSMESNLPTPKYTPDGFPETVEDYRMHTRLGRGNYGINQVNLARDALGLPRLSEEEFLREEHRRLEANHKK